MYNYQSFSKNDKKQLQNLLTIGVQREIKHFLKGNLAVYQFIVESEHEDIRKPYWKFYEKFQNFSKHLTKTYDGYSHRDIPTIIAGLLVDKHLNESDIANFSPQGQEKLKEMVNRIRSWRET